MVDRGERPPRRDEVVRDLRRMYLEREADALGVEHVDDRAPALGEVLIPARDRRPVVRREGIEHVPDRRAGEPRDDANPELRGGAGRVLHPLGGAQPHALGLAVSPDLGRQHAAVAVVDRVAYRLTDEVVAYRPALQPVALEELAAASSVARLGQRPINFEMIAPAREFQAIVAPGRTLRGNIVERQVGPLAGEERDRSRHPRTLPAANGRRRPLARHAKYGSPGRYAPST